MSLVTMLCLYSECSCLQIIRSGVTPSADILIDYRPLRFCLYREESDLMKAFLEVKSLVNDWLPGVQKFQPSHFLLKRTSH